MHDEQVNSFLHAHQHLVDWTSDAGIAIRAGVPFRMTVEDEGDHWAVTLATAPAKVIRDQPMPGQSLVITEAGVVESEQ